MVCCPQVTAPESRTSNTTLLKPFSFKDDFFWPSCARRNPAERHAPKPAMCRLVVKQCSGFGACGARGFCCFRLWVRGSLKLNLKLKPLKTPKQGPKSSPCLQCSSWNLPDSAEQAVGVLLLHPRASASESDTSSESSERSRGKAFWGTSPLWSTA